MGMVGSSDHYSVGFGKKLFEHHSPVFVLLGIGIMLEYAVSVLPVNVAEADNLLCLHILEVVETSSSYADTENLELAVKVLGSRFFFLFSCEKCVRSHCEAYRCSCSGLKERSAGNVFCHTYEILVIVNLLVGLQI